MRKLVTLAAVALIAAGCSAEQASDHAEKVKAEAGQAADAVAEKAEGAVDYAEKKATEAVAAVTGQEMTLEGTTGCGHCTWGKGASCAAALQTADGVVWILEDVKPDSKLFTERQESLQVTVMGTARVEDGQNYLAVKSFQM